MLSFKRQECTTKWNSNRPSNIDQVFPEYILLDYEKPTGVSKCIIVLIDLLPTQISLFLYPLILLTNAVKFITHLLYMIQGLCIVFTSKLIFMPFMIMYHLTHIFICTGYYSAFYAFLVKLVRFSLALYHFIYKNIKQ